MSTLAKLVVKLVTDVTEFTSGLNKASTQMTKVGQQMSSIGDKMTLGVTLPLLAAGTAAVKFASDLSETRNKTQTVFGNMASDVMKMGETANRALGMSENAALSYASTYGSILKNMGLAEDQVASMSQELTQLTADYASFHNLDPGEAFEKIKAGLVGSSEPLISLGKDLRVANVEAYAMANGIGTAGQELSQAELALARYGSLLSQSKDEMGDFARTSDGLANSSRILAATFEDTLASFGEVLIPTVTQFMQALIPILQFFNGLPAPVKQGIVYLALFAAALGPVLSFGGRILTLGGSIGKLFGTGGALASAGSWITGTMIPAVTGLTSSLGATAAAAGAIALPVIALVAAFGVLILVIKTFGKDALNTLKMVGAIIDAWVDGLIERARGIGPAISKSLYDAARSVMNQVRTWYTIGQNIIAGMINGVASFANALVDYILRVLQYSIEAVKNLLGIHSKSTVYYELGKNMMLGLEGGVDDYSGRPLQATVSAVNAVNPAAVEAIRPSRGQAIGIGPITINGDLSASAKEKLKAEIKTMFTETLAQALT